MEFYEETKKPVDLSTGYASFEMANMFLSAIYAVFFS